MAQFFLRILGTVAGICFLPACTNLAYRASNIGTSAEHLTPTGKIMTTESASFLQLSSQEWERRYKTWLYGGDMDYFKPKANSTPKLFYAEITPKQRKMKWYQLREEMISDKKTLIPEGKLQLRPQERVGWEKFDLRSGIWNPKYTVSTEYSDAGPGDSNPIIREKRTVPVCLQIPLGYLAFPLDMASSVVAIPIELIRD